MCCLSKHDDVAYIRHLVGLIQKQMCIESNRVYAFGFSAGLTFTFTLNKIIFLK